ncbi:MAG: hypothetical protein M1115_11690 [Actinobacteria bacterium]|nr:hypothetical protein [Actinomycetota bacterium]
MVRVLPDVIGLDREFDYLLPRSMGPQSEQAGGVGVGAMVRIELHGRRVNGWVVSEHSQPTEGIDLKPLAGYRGHGPSEEVVDLARWAAWRWSGPMARFLRTASPPRLILADLPARGEGAFKATGSRRGSLLPEQKALGESVGGGCTVLRLAPGIDRLCWVEAILELMDLAMGRTDRSMGPPSAIVLVPTQRGAEALSIALRSAGQDVARWPQQWDLAAAGGRIVVGARGAAWASAPDLCGIIVLDSHDERYQEERSPTWDGWVVAAERARRSKVPCVLISPCPTLVQTHSAQVVKTSAAFERKGWPLVEVVDRRGADPREGVLGERVVTALKRAIASGQHALCIYNRTGGVRLLTCRACGEPVVCESCGGAMGAGGALRAGGTGGSLGLRERFDSSKLQQSPSPKGGSFSASQIGEHDLLRCALCREARPQVCLRCGSFSLRVARRGVSRLRSELEAILGVEVGEVTGAVRDDAHLAGVPQQGIGGERPGATLRSGGGQIGGPHQAGGTVPYPQVSVVIGTEAVLHRAQAASLVVFLDMDQALLAPRFTASEEALALLALAARRTGGRDGHGRLMIQTRIPDHPAVLAACKGDPDLLASSEIPVRQALRLPPFSAIGLIRGPGAGDLALSISERDLEVEVRGPDAQGAWQVRAASHDLLCQALASPRPLSGRVRVSVDPRHI